VSCSSPPETNDLWTPYITYLPLISHLSPEGTIIFQDDQNLEGVDTIIFATGYNFSLPFCKITDHPWSDPTYQVLDGVIQPEERAGGKEEEAGGMKGLSMDKLDELMLFLRANVGRSIAFPTLRELSSSLKSGKWLTYRIPSRTVPTCRDSDSSHRSTLVRSTGLSTSASANSFEPIKPIPHSRIACYRAQRIIKGTRYQMATP
jgi:hypothetical protein